MCARKLGEAALWAPAASPPEAGCRRQPDAPPRPRPGPASRLPEASTMITKGKAKPGPGANPPAPRAPGPGLAGAHSGRWGWAARTAQGQSPRHSRPARPVGPRIPRSSAEQGSEARVEFSKVPGSPIISGVISAPTGQAIKKTLWSGWATGVPCPAVSAHGCHWVPPSRSAKGGVQGAGLGSAW